MTGYLLDTNVVSELTKDHPHPNVVAFLENENDTWLSSIVVHEIEFGLQLLPAGQRRSTLSNHYAEYLAYFSDRILPIDRSAAELAAKYRARARGSGIVVDLGDALIAGTAMAHGLTIATRNVRDFHGLGLDLYNPWDAT